MNILIAEDDADITELLRLYLENEQFTVFTAPDGEAAWQLFQSQNIHLCVLDIMMPKMNGYELAKKIRAVSKAPILFLSAKSDDTDKILGLNLGADDYVTKPFNPLEVAARIRSNLRRAYDMNETAECITAAGLQLNLNDLSCTKNGIDIQLTPTEYRILSLLMKNPNRIFTKVQIYENVCGEYFESDDNTMMVHISKLREKIEDDPKDPKYIKTIRGLGYKFEDKN